MQNIVPISQFNNYQIPNELVIIILEYLLLQQLIKFTEVNKSFNILIKNIKWNHKINIFRVNHIKYITKNYSFIKFIFDEFTFHEVKYLTNIKKITLFNCEMNSEDLFPVLKNCESISLLDYEGEFNSEDFEYLSCTEFSMNNQHFTDTDLENLFKYCKIKTLKLWCAEVSNKSFKYLQNCENVCLASCNINDSDFHYLSNIKKLNILGCNISHKALIYLENIYKLNLRYCENISKGLKYLKNCHTIILIECNLYDEDIKHLTHCKELKLNSNNITGECFKYLTNCKTLDLSFNDISNGNFSLLKNCLNLTLSYTEITDNNIENLVKHYDLSKIYNINLKSCSKLTNRCMKYLKYYNNVDISHTKITKFKNLKNCCRINLCGLCLTKRDLKILKNCQEIIVSKIKIPSNKKRNLISLNYLIKY